MITTFFFIQLIAFQLWYVTSEQVEHARHSAYLLHILRHKQAYRIVGVALLLTTMVLFVMRFGWMTGICAGTVGLMGVGGLVVMLSPFRYMNQNTVIALYVFLLTLEFLV
jgi:hypothetical protein